MFQFEVLSGTTAGGTWLARRFPLNIGRSTTSDIRLEDPGVYEEHATLCLDDQRRLQLAVHEPALAALNGQPTTSAPLRNGDHLTLGSASLRIWLAPVRQAHLRWGEACLWALWIGAAGAQILLMRWLWR